MNSPAFEAVVSAKHPAPADGGPCATCAFRQGTEANRTAHTMMLAAMCVESLRPFYCHEKPQLCRGYIAAANLRGAPRTKADRRHAEACGLIADALADGIAAGVRADEQHRARVTK